jgi:hypothetical protein
MLDSYYYILIEIIICFIITITLVYYYARKNINPAVLFITWITWFLNLSLVVLLPFDIYYTQTKTGINNGIPPLTENILYYGYNSIYWSTFFLGWIFIPLMSAYEKSGEFTKIEKLKRAIKRNLIYYGILLAIGIIIFIYSAAQVGIGETLILSKDLSLFYGIIFFFFLLSYSLIKYPKSLYEKLNYSKQIKYIEWKSNKFFEKLDEIKYDLMNSMFQLKSTMNNIDELKKTNEEDSIGNKKSSKNSSLSTEKEYKKNNKSNSLNMDEDLTEGPKRIKDYLDEIKTIYNDFSQISDIYGIDFKKEKYEEKKPIIDIKDLIELNRKMNKKKQDSLRMQCRIRHNYKNWVILRTLEYLKNKNNNNNNIEEKTDIEENKDIKKDDILSLQGEGFIPLENFSKCKEFYYSKIRKYLIIIFIIINILAGVITIICEFLMMLKIPFFHDILYEINNIYLIHIISLVPLIYLLLMSNHTLFTIKISSYIYMYGHKQTDSVSLMKFSSYLSRIYFAICLNSKQCLNQVSENQKSKFQDLFKLAQNEKEETFGFLMCRFSPLFLVLSMILFFLDVPGKFANFMGFDLFEFESEERDLGIKEGHKYLMSLNKKLNGKLLENYDPKIFEER